MKFSELKYERINIEDVKSNYEKLLNELESADNKEDFIKIFYKIDDLGIEVFTSRTLAQVRHSIDTSNEFYDEEKKFWDENGPLFSKYDFELAKICLSKDFKEDLYDEISETYFMQAECMLKTYSDEIYDDLIEENKLVSEYEKIKAKAQIKFEGKILNLSSLSAYFEDDDREIRRKAHNAMSNFYKENDLIIGEIFDKLVKLRDKMAKKLGYENYIELGYYRMNRLDYNENDVSEYRKQIVEYVVPLVSEFNRRKKERLNLDKIRYYDWNYNFKTGNPKPSRPYDELIKGTIKMYSEMSKETHEFINELIGEEYIDLVSKPNKELGGYCTSIEKYKKSFVFSNFNGTSHDIDVLCHEVGHGFQYFMSKDIRPYQLRWPTMESAEIDSMSMEFFTHPWLENFLGKDTEKYYFNHVVSSISFLPYGALIDHFQHEVYKHPEYSIEQRRQCFRSLEKMYLPDKDYEGDDFNENGGFYYRQGHIFHAPFYYIDYALAQICALQFFEKSLVDYNEAFNRYLTLVKLGGTKPFKKLCEAASLKIPFEKGSVKETIDAMSKYIEQFDDSKM